MPLLCRDGSAGDWFRLSQWRQLGGPEPWSPLHGTDEVGTLAVIKGHMATLIEKVEDHWAQYRRDNRIEFVLDYEDLNLDVDQWPWENDTNL